MSMSFFKLALLLATIFFANASLSGAIYKWTDDKGQTHYSEKKPANVDATQINAYRSPKNNPIPTKPVASASNDDDSDDDSDENKPSKTAPKLVSKDPEVCAKASENLAIMLRTPIVRQNGIVMTIDEKNAAIADMKEIQAVHCP